MENKKNTFNRFEFKPTNFGFRRTNPFKPNNPIPPSNRFVSWKEINDYLLTLDDTRKHLCFGCGVSYLYDKNDKKYPVTRNNTLEQVKALVEEIRKINAQ